MARGDHPGKMGRPKISIDKEAFEKLCIIMCTLVDIAGWFDCSEDTIENWCKSTYGVTFSEVYKKKSGKGRVSLRRKQYEVAMTGDKTLLIWLGKQQLGQSDKLTQTIDANVKQQSTEQKELVDGFKDLLKTIINEGKQS